MISIEKIAAGAHGKKTRYRVVDIGRDRATVAIVEGLERAGCLVRFLKGSHLQPNEYQLAIDVMAEIDAREGGAEGAG